MIPGSGLSATWSGPDLELRFPSPADPLSENDSRSLHWAARARRTKPWHTMALLATRRALAGRRIAPPVPVTIQVALPFRMARGRDPHNYVGTTIKAIVDGVKDAGLIPDDTPEWATVLEPTVDIQRDKTRPLMATVTIKRRTP